MAKHKNHAVETVTVRYPAGSFDPDDWKKFVELPYFRKKWLHLGLGDDDLRALQMMLTATPRIGPVVAGTGGLRKFRFAKINDGRGKSGSYRTGYVYFEDFGVIGLIAVYAKQEQGNFTAEQKKAIKTVAIPRLYEWVKTGGQKGDARA